MAISYQKQLAYLMTVPTQVIWELSHNIIRARPIGERDHWFHELDSLKIIYSAGFRGNGHWALTVSGREAVAQAMSARGLVGYKATVVTDDERQERKVHAIAARKNARRDWLAEHAKARGLAIHEEARRMAQMLTRGLEETECVSCGCEIEYKQLRIFERSKRYECTICGLRVRPKKVPKDVKAGRLPVIAINGGLGAVVCYDCVEYCSSCWTTPTYKHIMKVYGVDLRDA